MARVITSPTTVPMLPPTNFSSIAQMWTRRPFRLPAGGNDGVAQVRGFLRCGQPILVFFRIDERQRVRGGEALIEFFELSVVE